MGGHGAGLADVKLAAVPGKVHVHTIRTRTTPEVQPALGLTALVLVRHLQTVNESIGTTLAPFLYQMETKTKWSPFCRRHFLHSFSC